MKRNAIGNWSVAAGTAAVLVATATGCGQNGSTTNSAGSSGGGTNGSTITLGVLAPFTGPYGQAGSDLMKGIQLAVNEINAAGGADGKQIKVVTEDSVSDPTDAVPAMAKLINIDKADIIVGPRTLTASAVLPLSQKAQIPDMIVGGSTQLDTNTDPYFWRTSPSDSKQGIAMAYYAIEKGFKTAALVFEQQPAAQTLKAPILQSYEKNGGKIVSTVDIVPGQSSYRSEIQKIFASKPQVIFTQVSPQTASVLFPEVQQMGYLTVPWIGTNTMDSSDFYKAVGSGIASGYIYAVQSSSQGGLASTNFVKLYQKAYGTDQIANLANNIYDAVIIEALAIDEAKSTNGPAVNAAITQISNPPGTAVGDYATGLKLIQQGQKINWEGASGSDDFNQYHNVFGPFVILKFDQNGSTSTLETLPAEKLSKFSQ